MKRVLPLLLAVACTTEPEKAPSTSTEPAAAPDPVPPVDPGPADPLPSDPPEDPSVESESLGDADARPAPEATHRAIKRMSVAQAKAALIEVSGGIVWSSGSTTYWDTYADTLGVANYQTILADNLDPNIMFQKFLDDAATHTCDQWVASDAESADFRFFAAAEPDATDPASVTANILALRTLIHGRDSAADDPIIEGYREVFETVLRRSDDPIAAWTTVCVGFFTHPHFFTY
jgi:hypothetical protein